MTPSSSRKQDDVPRNHYSVRARLLILASEMASAMEIPSPRDGDHPKQRPRKYWLIKLEQAFAEYSRCSRELNQCISILKSTEWKQGPDNRYLSL